VGEAVEAGGGGGHLIRLAWVVGEYGLGKVAGEGGEGEGKIRSIGC
jgi:hypothetical protein